MSHFNRNDDRNACGKKMKTCAMKKKNYEARNEYINAYVQNPTRVVASPLHFKTQVAKVTCKPGTHSGWLTKGKHSSVDNATKFESVRQQQQSNFLQNQEQQRQHKEMAATTTNNTCSTNTQNGQIFTVPLAGDSFTEIELPKMKIEIEMHRSAESNQTRRSRSAQSSSNNFNGSSSYSNKSKNIRCSSTDSKHIFTSRSHRTQQMEIEKAEIRQRLEQLRQHTKHLLNKNLQKKKLRSNSENGFTSATTATASSEATRKSTKITNSNTNNMKTIYYLDFSEQNANELSSQHKNEDVNVLRSQQNCQDANELAADNATNYSADLYTNDDAYSAQSQQNAEQDDDESKFMPQNFVDTASSNQSKYQTTFSSEAMLYNNKALPESKTTTMAREPPTSFAENPTKRIGILRKPEVVTLTNLYDCSSSNDEIFACNKENYNNIKKSATVTTKRTVQFPGTQLDTPSAQLKTNRMLHNHDNEIRNKKPTLPKSKKIKAHTKTMTKNNLLPILLRPNIESNHPYGFIFAVRRKLESLMKPTTIERSKTNTRINAKKLSTLTPTPTKKTCKSNNMSATLNGNSLQEKKSTNNEEISTTLNTSGISTATHKMYTSTNDTETEDMPQLLKPRSKVKITKPLNDDDATTVSSSIFDSPQKSKLNDDITQALSPLCAESIEHLSVESTNKLQAAIKQKHICIVRGDNTLNKSKVNEETDINLSQLLIDFNRSLSEVMQVNEQLKYKTKMGYAQNCANTTNFKAETERQTNENNSNTTNSKSSAQNEQANSLEQTYIIDNSNTKDACNLTSLIPNWLLNPLTSTKTNVTPYANLTKFNGKDDILFPDPGNLSDFEKIIIPKLDLRCFRSTDSETELCSSSSSSGSGRTHSIDEIIYVEQKQACKNSECYPQQQQTFTYRQSTSSRSRNIDIYRKEELIFKEACNGGISVVHTDADNAVQLNNRQSSSNDASCSMSDDKIANNNIGNSVCNSNSRTMAFKKQTLPPAKDNEIVTIFQQSGLELSIVSSESETNLNYSNVGLYEKLLKDETTKSEHLTTLLKIREKVLLDRTKSQIAWLEVQKEKFKSKGLLMHISTIKKKQRAILLKMEKEREDIKRLLQNNTLNSTSAKPRNHHTTPCTNTNVNNAATRHLATTLNQRWKHDFNSIENTTTTDTTAVSPLVLSAPAVLGGKNNRNNQNGATRSLSTILRGDYNIESSKSLEELLKRRELDLRQRREHVERLIEWHKRLDQEETEVLQLEHMLLNSNNAIMQQSELKDTLHTTNNSRRTPQTNMMATAVTAAEKSELDNTTTTIRSLKMDRRLKEIDKSLRELNTISNHSSSSTRTTQTSETDNGTVTTDFVRATGSKLNRLWRRLTSQQIEKFEPNRCYKLCKNDLERIYEDAKKTVIHDFEQNRDQTTLNLVDKSIETDVGGGVGGAGETNKTIDNIQDTPLQRSSDSSENSEKSLTQSDDTVNSKSDYCPCAVESNFSAALRRNETTDSETTDTATLYTSRQEINERKNLIEKNIQKFLTLTKKLVAEQSGLKRSLSDNQISPSHASNSRLNKQIQQHATSSSWTHKNTYSKDILRTDSSSTENVSSSVSSYASNNIPQDDSNSNIEVVQINNMMQENCNQFSQNSETLTTNSRQSVICSVGINPNSLIDNNLSVKSKINEAERTSIHSNNLSGTISLLPSYESSKKKSSNTSKILKDETFIDENLILRTHSDEGSSDFNTYSRNFEDASMEQTSSSSADGCTLLQSERFTTQSHQAIANQTTEPSETTNRYENDFEPCSEDTTRLEDESMPLYETTIETTAEEELEQQLLNDESSLILCTEDSSNADTLAASESDTTTTTSLLPLPPPPASAATQQSTTSPKKATYSNKQPTTTATATNSNPKTSVQLMPDIINNLEGRRQAVAGDIERKQFENVAPYVFMREIPNKPPPPYVPPAPGSPMTTIFPSEERIRDITFRRSHEIYCQLSKTDFTNTKGEKMPSVMDEQITNIYERIILDICREYLDEHMEALTQGDPANFHTQLAFFNPPDRLRCIQNAVYKEVRRCLAMNKILPKRSQVFSIYGQRARRDHIGKIIIQEMNDEDDQWCNFYREEIEVLDLMVEEMIGQEVQQLAKEVVLERNQTHTESTPSDTTSDISSYVLMMQSKLPEQQTLTSCNATTDVMNNSA